jgi:quercetin dioxygenase-like cupin family protein
VRIAAVPFSTLDWSTAPRTTQPGLAGRATSRSLEVGDLRVRMVEYSPGYVADHWCDKGHVLLVLAGELTTELRSGERHVLRAGTSYQVGDGVAPHRSSTATGATLFIVD